MRTHTYYDFASIRKHTALPSPFLTFHFIFTTFLHMSAFCVNNLMMSQINLFVKINGRWFVALCMCVYAVFTSSQMDEIPIGYAMNIRDDIATLKIWCALHLVFFLGYFKSFFLRLAKHKEDKPYNINFNHHL